MNLLTISAAVIWKQTKGWFLSISKDILFHLDGIGVSS